MKRGILKATRLLKANDDDSCNIRNLYGYRKCRAFFFVKPNNIIFRIINTEIIYYITTNLPNKYEFKILVRIDYITYCEKILVGCHLRNDTVTSATPSTRVIAS